MKKYFVFILCLLMICSTAYAQITVDSISVDYQNAEVTVSGKADNGESAVGLYIYSDTDTAAFEQANVQNKSFLFNVGFKKEYLNTNLSMEISQYGETPVTMPVYFMGKDELSQWLRTVNTETNGGLLKNHTDAGYDKVLYYLLNRTTYDSYSDRLFDTLVSFKQNYSKPEEYADDINRAIILVKINEALTAEEIKAYLTPDEDRALLGLSGDMQEGSYERIKTFRDDRSTSETLSTAGVGFNSPAELRMAIREAECMIKINSTQANDMKAVLNEYTDVLSIVNPDFPEIMEDYSSAAARSITNKNFTTLSTAIDTLSAAIEQQKNTNSILNGGGNIGFGGGGGGGGSLIGDPISSPSPEIVEEAEKIAGFVDLEGYDWATEAIEQLVDMQIVNGKGDDKFEPEQGISREEFVKMAVLVLDKYDGDAECSFGDVTKGDWYYPYVASAVKHELINGIGDGKFGVGEMISRQDIVTILHRAIKDMGLIDAEGDTLPFSDAEDISEYALDAVKTFYKLGTVKGFEDGSFAPTKGATRAEGAVIIYNVHKLLASR